MLFLKQFIKTLKIMDEKIMTVSNQPDPTWLEKMGKPLLIGAGVLLSLSLLANVLLGYYNSSKSGKIKALSADVAQSSALATNYEGQNNDLQQSVIALEEENQLLIDSINQLNTRIRDMKSRIRRQKKAIEDVRKAIAKKEDDYQDAARALVKLKKKKEVDDTKMIALEERIKKLEAKKTVLDTEIGQLLIKNDSLKESQTQLYEEILTKEEEKKEFIQRELIFNIVNNTKAIFHHIGPRKQNEKEAKNAKRWHHTLIDLSLDHEDLSLLEDQQFLLKIISTETGKIVSPREDEGGTQGISFVFNGNPVPQIKYVNYEGKTGEKFGVQVFYLKNGQEYLLTHGSGELAF